MDYGYELLPAPNNEFYLVGYIQNQNNYGYVLKLNQFGDTLWSKYIFAENSGRVYSAANSADSCCVFVVEMNDSSLIVKIDPNGNTVWSKSSSISAAIYDIKLVSDGGFVVCGNQSIIGYVARYNSNGDMLWNRQYPGGTQKGFQSLIEKNGEGFLITGYIYLPAIDSGKALLSKIDYSGNIVFEKYYGADKYSFGSKMKVINNNIFIGGDSFYNSDNYQIFLIKLNNNNELSQIKLFTHANTSYEFMDDLEIVNTNRIILSNRLDTNFPNLRTYSKIRILDSNFNTIHQWISPSYGYSSLTSILPLNNGDIIFGGTFEYGSIWVERGFDFYAVRSDSDLNVGPLPPIGLVNSSTLLPKNASLYQNYPNPFNPSTKIKFMIPHSRVVSEGRGLLTNISIYDISGRLVKTLLSQNMKPGTYEVDFNASGLSSGAYFYRINAGDFTDTKKMILLK